MEIEARHISTFKHAIWWGDRARTIHRVVHQEDRVAICCDPNLILIRSPKSLVNVVLIDDDPDPLPTASAMAA